MQTYQQRYRPSLLRRSGQALLWFTSGRNHACASRLPAVHRPAYSGDPHLITYEFLITYEDGTVS